MVPTIRSGEKVLIRPLAPGEPTRGQILAFHRGLLVTHRYRGNGRCQGDNAVRPDAPVPTEAYVGIVVAVMRAGRHVPLHRRRPWRTQLHRLRLVLAARWRAQKKV